MLLSNDAPKEDLMIDKLGVREFANKIAASMLYQKTNSGIVYGLEGAWGSGKSTLKNHILKQVDETFQGNPNEKPIIVEFDPWILRSVQPLVGALLEEIKTALLRAAAESNYIEDKVGGKIGMATARATRYREALIALGEFAGAITDFAASGVVANTLLPGFKLELPGKVLIAGAKLLPKGADDDSLSIKTLKEHKHRVNKSLQSLNRQVIISIDDIDRLDPDEIMEVMRVVRSVADFANTTYLLNYDPVIVANAAKKVHEMEGPQEYLEKIVNVPIRVPVPEAFDLIGWFESEVSEVFDEFEPREGWPHKTEQGDDLHAAISEVGIHFFKTPRDVTRTLNAVRLALGSLSSNLWLPDLVWISIIKIGSGGLYDWIERYLSEFAIIGVGDAVASQHDQDSFSRSLAKLGDSLGLSERLLRQMLGRRLDGVSLTVPEDDPKRYDTDGVIDPFAVIDKGVFGTIRSQELDELRSTYRLSSPDYYRLYFGYQNPRVSILPQDVSKLVNVLSDDQSRASEYLTSLDEERISKLPTKLEKLFRYLAESKMRDLDNKLRARFLAALTEIMDSTIRFEKVEFGSSRRGWRGAAELVPFIFSRMTEDSVSDLVVSTFEKGDALSWLTFIARRSQPDSRSTEKSSWLSVNQFNLAKNALTKRYSEMDISELKRSAMPTQNLFAWANFAGEEVVRESLERYSKLDLEFMEALELLFNVSYEASSSGLRRIKRSAFIDPSDLSRDRVPWRGVTAAS